MPQQAAYDALLLDYAAGALDPARALLLEAHWMMTPAAAAAAGEADALGGLLLERATPSPLHAAPALPQATDLAVRTPPESEDARIIALAAAAPDALRWLRAPLGARVAPLGPQNLTLLRLQGGAALPDHDHDGDEWTLVLRGAYQDAYGVHERGDLFYAQAGMTHRPRAISNEDCVCLVLRDGKMLLRGVWGVLAAGAEMINAAGQKR